MNDRRLRFDLADLAGQVHNVDLRDRVLRSSRRLGVTRALAASAAVLVVLAGAAGVAFAVRPAGKAVRPEGKAVPATATAPLLGGTRWYIEFGDSQSIVHAVRGDHDDVRVRVPNGGGQCVANTITVSPDGAWAAWAAGDDVTGRLQVQDLAAGTTKTLDDEVLCLGAAPLIWAGGGRLVVTEGNRQSMVTVSSRVSSPLPAGEEFQAASPDGSWVAKQKGEERRVVNGQQSRVYRYTPPAGEADRYDGWAARGVSADGRYIAVGWIGTDPARQLSTFAVVDTTTGKAVAPPVAGGVHFLADGRVLVRQPGRVVVLDAQLHQLGEVAEPAAVQKMELFAYSP